MQDVYPVFRNRDAGGKVIIVELYFEAHETVADAFWDPIAIENESIGDV